MPRLEIRDFRAEDVMNLADIHDPEARELNCRRAVMVERIPGPKYSAFLDGRCIGAGGAMWIHGRVFKCWVNVTPELTKQKLTFHKLVVKLFRDFKDKYPWERIEAECFADLLNNHKWAESFGFTKSGEPERKAGPRGEDVYRFSIVR